MNLEWLQDDNNDSGNHCDHIEASFITSKNQTLNDIKNPYTAVECSDNIERIFKAIAEKNLDKVKEIVNQHKQRCQNFGGDPDFKWDIVNDLSKNWSPLHYSVFHGQDKIFLWFLSVGGDIEQITYDGYSCLILAVMANHPTMVSLLIAQSNLNINHVSRKGSALHIAAIQNNQLILKMLLKHPNINLNIYNDDQLRAIDVAQGKAKEIISEELQLRTETQQALLMSSFISSMKNTSVPALNTFIANQPKKPPIYKGYVQKLHISRLYMYLRYIIVDPDNGVLARYEDISQVPLNPKEVIPLSEISNLQIQKQTWFSKQNYTYLLIEYGQQKLYFSFTSETIAKIWFDLIKLAVGYTKYVKYKLDQYNFSKEETKLYQTVIQLLMENANQQIEVRDSYLPSAGELKFDSQNFQSTQFKDEKFTNQPNFKSFKILDTIGKGSFGFVFKVISLENSKTYALKQQNKEQLKRLSQFEYAINELKLMQKINHPFIIEICCAFQTKNNLYYLMEYQERGDLSLYIGKGAILTENHSKFLIAQVVLAIEYLHKFDIVYRDLKPQNIIVGNDGYLKLVDLGLAKQIQNDRSAFSFCGSPAYLAPETITGNGVNKSVDVYGIGLLLYEMVCGYPPHFTYNIEDLINRIQYSPVNYDGINSLSNSVKKLLKSILKKDNSKRPTIAQIKEHIFFADIDWHKLYEKTMIPPKLLMRNQQPIIHNEYEVDEDYCCQKGENYVEEWDFY